MLTDALEAIRTALGEARRAIGALRASPLEDMGLPRALRALAASEAARAGIALELQVSDALEGLDIDAEHGIYRIAAEALANVVRHARAQHMTVKLEQVSGGLRLTIADDGRGFDPGGAGEGRFGLYGMRERARIIGAELEIESEAGKGSTLRLTLPQR